MKSSILLIITNEPINFLKTTQFQYICRHNLTGILVIAFLLACGRVKANDENRNVSPAEQKLTNKISENHSLDELVDLAAELVIECAEFGKEHGVVLEIQNHNNFLKTEEDVIRLIELTDHEWVGLMLDVGSYRTKDPYHDIAETIKYAISWQLKELVYIDQVNTPVDLNMIKEIILKSEYKWYLPIETLGSGDPYEKVEQF